MKIAGITLGVVILLVSFLFYILSLMQLVPLIIEGPLLFLAILIIFTLLHNHNKFRGFKK
ncbi:hypothetical protein V7151_25025 [Priestia megaterium]|uniref:hypothetical protein n=1 Tax=Priestia megaterium TaxID=1404 RepID=UPI002FFD6C51